jgi:hypothetical protein
MMRDYLRLFGVALFFFLAASLQACSGNAPTNSVGTTPANQPPPSSNSSPVSPSGPDGYQGYHDIANCNAILAWAWDTSRPNDPVKLDIYDGTVLIATEAADVFRQDLVDVGKGNGKHGLYFPVPPQLKDGKPHTIVIKFAGTDVQLSNPPKEINCNLE